MEAGTVVVVVGAGSSGFKPVTVGTAVVVAGCCRSGGGRTVRELGGVGAASQEQEPRGCHYQQQRRHYHCPSFAVIATPSPSLTVLSRATPTHGSLTHQIMSLLARCCGGGGASLDRVHVERELVAVFSMGRRRVVLLVVVLASGMLGAEPVAAVDGSGGGGVVAVGGFDDVGDGVHAPAVEALEEEGVFDGTECGDGLFCPGEPILRWVAAVWLIRVLDEEPAAAGSSRFSDVDAGQWWAPYVETLADVGVTRGCATGPLRFCPDESVTRAQMASFLVRAFGLEAAGWAGFADTAGSTHEANIDALAAGRVTAGCATGPLRFCPDKAVTRAQMATFLARATGLVPLPTGSTDIGPGAVGEPTLGHDPFRGPALSDIDLGSLRQVVSSLDDPTTCPPANAPVSLVDVAEILRVVDGCLVVDYEPFGGRTPEEVQADYADDPDVLAVGLPVLVDVLCVVEEPDVEDQQWHLGALGAERLREDWPVGSDKKKRQVNVAVIDFLVDTRHYDLDETVVLPAYASVSSLGNTPCVNDHGTHVAGIIAAEPGNGLGGAGVAPDATVLSFPIGPAATAIKRVNSLTDLIHQAIAAGAEVINISLGVGEAVTQTNPTTGAVTISFKYNDSPVQICPQGLERCQDPLETLIISATMGIGRGDGVGVVFVAAAGNCGNRSIDPRCQYADQVVYPAGYPTVISVASSTRTGDHADFSSANDSVDITAPGDSILSTTVTESSEGRQHLMTWKSGTSMAAPMISSIVAHLKARFPSATHCHITDALYKTAYFPPSIHTTAGTLSPTTQQLGYGHVRPQAAIEHLPTTSVGTACAPPPEDTTTSTAETYSAVEVGDNYSCGLRTGGTVVCWGLNNANQASPPADTKFTAISAGQLFTCGLRQDRTIQCWGQGNPPPDGEFRALTVDDNHGCAIKTDGLAVCWMIRPLGSAAKAEAPAVVRFADIAASAMHSCGITDARSGRSVVCWGDDEAAHGFSGGGQVSDRPRGRGFLEVAADSEYACAIRTNRTIICWGGDDIRGRPTGRTTPPPSDEFRDVAPGHQHACGIRVDGSIACWGRDTDEVLSDAPTSGAFTDISSGDFHSCALRDNGTIECWGRNNYGQTVVP